jgi:tRNA A-37 threonylcarbamoyl transferase component Bud32
MKYLPPRLPHRDTPATVDSPNGSRSVRRPPRCRVAVSLSGGSAFQGAIESLLHRRLLFVALLALIPLSIFLIRNLLDTNLPPFLSGVGAILQSVVVAVASIVAWILWRRPRLDMCTLRTMELLLFGSLALFFSWLQYESFLHGPLEASSRCEWAPLILRHAVGNSSTRWFFLIIAYGVFIPNTWRRCLFVSLMLALTPLLLTPLAVAHHHSPWHADLFFALSTMAIFLAIAVAMAVFGSHRIQVLESQAFEAQQLGQYRLGKRLGSGGMGEVYLAEHLLLRRPCAVKLIRGEKAGDSTNLQRFEREVQAMATLTHWNTVEIYDYGHADDGTFYYVMEYLPGQNLEQLVGLHGPLPPARAIHLLRQVCRALREAHGIGLLHRDIKPSNIIACERGGVFDVVKLLDFGLVQENRLGRPDDRLTQHGTIVGSPPYMSPEQAAGRNELDARSDIYSLGAVAYFLLTGQPPFVRDTAMLMLMAHAYEPVVPLAMLRPEMPVDLQEVVMRCLEKDPARRFPDVHSVEQALAACADADQWSEDQAALWWHEHPLGRFGEKDLRPDVPTQIAV